MTPKEQYEARKRERKARQEQLEYELSENEIRTAEMHDAFDRAVTALERIADALESKP